MDNTPRTVSFFCPILLSGCIQNDDVHEMMATAATNATHILFLSATNLQLLQLQIFFGGGGEGKCLSYMRERCPIQCCDISQLLNQPDHAATAPSPLNE